MFIPEKLLPGDCIGIFSPAGPVRDLSKADAGITVLKQMGFAVKHNVLSAGNNGYLAGDDQCRVREFHAMLADDETKALLALRGGFGCMRIAGMIDYEKVRLSKKHIIGFSDLTVLLNSILRFSGMTAIHGPVLTTLAASSQATKDSFFSLLTEGLPGRISDPEIVVVRPGKAKGILCGGNLATIVHSLGTPWEIEWTGALLLLEDTGEPLYKIDRMLTQLYHANRLAEVTGIILGTFDTGENAEEDNRLQEMVWQRVLELTASYKTPVWGNFPAGHRERNLAVPLGAEMIMNSESAALTVSFPDSAPNEH